LQGPREKEIREHFTVDIDRRRETGIATGIDRPQMRVVILHNV